MNAMNKKLTDAALVVVCLLVLGRLILYFAPQWREDSHQQAFGKQFAATLLLQHKELQIETIDFEGDKAYAVFDVALSDFPYVQSRSYINTLHQDIQNAYCSEIVSAGKNLNIPLFHVNIRALGTEGSSIVLSPALSPAHCATS